MLNMYPKKESRFSRKLDSLFWWIVRLFPLVLYAFVSFAVVRNEQLPVVLGNDYTFVLENYLSFEFLFRYFGISEFDFISITLRDIFADGGYIAIYSVSSGFFQYFVYLVGVELLRLFLDIILFIPKLARKWINMACQDD